MPGAWPFGLGTCRLGLLEAMAWVAVLRGELAAAVMLEFG
jgi:hypothetical protein